MKNIGKISVVMPCFRAERYAGRMIDGIKSQTYPDWELIVVSNGAGQEAQLAIANSYAENDERITVVSLPQGGVSNARNEGMRRASGEWLAFVDADDVVEPQYLEYLADGVRDGVDMVMGGYTHIVRQGDSEGFRVTLEGGHGFDRYFVRTSEEIFNPLWNKLLCVSVLRNQGGYFDPFLSRYEDAQFNYEFLCFTHRVNTIPYCGYHYFSIGAASTYTKYHPCEEAGRNKCRDGRLRMWREAGIEGQELRAEYLRLLYDGIFNIITNLFKSGCPLSFAELSREVRRIVFADKDTFRLLCGRDTRGDRRSVRLFFALIRSRSPLLMTAVLRALFALRRLPASLSALSKRLCRGSWRL